MEFRGFEYFRELREKRRQTPFPKAYMGLASPLGAAGRRRRLLYDQLFCNEQVFVPASMVARFRLDVPTGQRCLVPVELHHLFGEVKAIKVVNRYLWESEAEELNEWIRFWFGASTGEIMIKTLFAQGYSPFMFYPKPRSWEEAVEEYIRTHLSWARWISEDYLIAALLGLSPCLFRTLHEQMRCRFAVKWRSGDTSEHGLIELTEVADAHDISGIERVVSDKDSHHLLLDSILSDGESDSVNYESIPLADYLELIETREVRKLREQMWALMEGVTSEHIGAELEEIKKARNGYLRAFMSSQNLPLYEVAVPTGIDLFVWYFEIFDVPVVTIAAGMLTLRDFLSAAMKEVDRQQCRRRILDLKTEFDARLDLRQRDGRQSNKGMEHDK